MKTLRKILLIVLVLNVFPTLTGTLILISSDGDLEPTFGIFVDMWRTQLYLAPAIALMVTILYLLPKKTL